MLIDYFWQENRRKPIVLSAEKCSSFCFAAVSAKPPGNNVTSFSRPQIQSEIALLFIFRVNLHITILGHLFLYGFVVLGRILRFVCGLSFWSNLQFRYQVGFCPLRSI